MLLSLILAWLTVVFGALAAFKFIARISGNKALNRFFHKIHIPFGVLMLITGILHGILAGNPSSATLSNFTFAPVLFTLNWGTACLVLMLGLALTYLLRKQLKKGWMTAHRVLTVALIAVLVLHISAMGIQLFDRISGSTATQTTVVASSESASSGSTSSSGSGTSSSSAAASSGSSSSSSSSSSSASSSGAVTFSGATLKDGTYQGSADGYSGTTTVSVTVSGGKVTKISVDSESDSPQFFSRAESLLDTIVSQQSLEVDAVSGATFSSAGLINAVSDALQKAVTSGTLKVNSIDTSSIQRGGH